ncbi:Integrase, catalytic core [Corchorus capsularis]|uniref:Integrase, catalytic core n=1 Tax=Corchorus capsularis TaxID=210143 RepID=A0A1R3GIQ6_COCAP|nr:Integrase, catalytic core [Corchorus capsularis]
MGCVLAQQDDTGKKEHAIYHLSKRFTDYEIKYSALERICCALAWAAHRLRQYMLYHTTWLVSKLDPIKYVFEKPGLSRRIARWQVLLSEYDIEYVSQKAVKGSAIADFLADRARDEYEPVSFEFPDEDLMTISHVEEVKEGKWRVYFDGASNLSGQGIGAVSVSPEEDYYPATARLKFPATYNVAEYEACVLVIQLALERKVKRVEIYGDSALVIYQMKGEWQARDPKLVLYKNYVSELVKPFEKVTFHHLPREDNQMADALATVASMFRIGANTEIRPIHVQTKNLPAHVMSVEDEPDGNPWYFDILQYLKRQVYPEHATEVNRRTLRRMASGYFLSGETLYKKSRDGALMRCVDSAEARKILKEIHGESYGGHSNGYGLPERIITDNASNLNRGLVEVTCKQFKITYSNSTIYRPKMNGAVEAANKNIKRIIERMTVTYRDWHEKLPFAFHAYRTCVRTSTGATPYSLVYGMEAVVPIEVEIPSLKIYRELRLEEDEWIQERIDQLNLIDEKRVTAICHGQLYQRRMERAYNKKVRPRQFKEGDLVLKRIFPDQRDPRGKWTPNWEGPYKKWTGKSSRVPSMQTQ